MIKYFMAADPGKSGAIAIINSEKLITACYKIPIQADEVDIIQLLKIIEFHKDCSHCVIEDVHSIFGVSAKSNFEFGRVLGMIEVAVKSQNIPVTKVSPKVWQNEMWQGIKIIQNATHKKDRKGNIKYKVDTKGTSLLAAANLFPKHKFTLVGKQKKPDNNEIDAALMAEYCRRKFK